MLWHNKKKIKKNLSISLGLKSTWINFIICNQIKKCAKYGRKILICPKKNKMQMNCIVTRRLEWCKQNVSIHSGIFQFIVFGKMLKNPFVPSVHCCCFRHHFHFAGQVNSLSPSYSMVDHPFTSLFFIDFHFSMWTHTHTHKNVRTWNMSIYLSA